jgi:hypothetical protein
MNSPVEIEFAVDIDKSASCPVVLNFLQIRPIVINEQNINFRINRVNADEVIVYSEKALGNGSYINVCGIVYVKPEYYKPSVNESIADEIEGINSYFVKQNKGYVLIGPGRWAQQTPGWAYP